MTSGLQVWHFNSGSGSLVIGQLGALLVINTLSDQYS